jgi:hypothetical protein
MQLLSYLFSTTVKVCTHVFVPHQLVACPLLAHVDACAALVVDGLGAGGALPLWCVIDQLALRNQLQLLVNLQRAAMEYDEQQLLRQLLRAFHQSACPALPAAASS